MSNAGSEVLQAEDVREPQKGLLEKCGITGNKLVWVRKFMAEFLCLTFFTFVAAASSNSLNNLEEATAQGLTIALLVISFGHISGAHINPAVTLGVLLSGGISAIGAVIYWVAQFLGGIFGGFLAWAVMKHGLYMLMNGGTTPVMHHNATLFEAYLMETFITTILVYTVLMCAVHQETQTNAGLAIGFAVFIGVITGGKISDGSMNPARSLGPLVTYSGAWMPRDGTGKNFTGCGDRTVHCIHPHEVWKVYWVDIIGPLTGALIAAAIYRIFYASDVPSLKSTFSTRRPSTSRGSATGYGTL